ncbi:MAG: PepSY domain-containing protein [Bacteroidota bacterium]
MTISIWRLSHMLLALSISVFLVLASITGLILAFEPINGILESKPIADLERVNLAQTMEALDDTYKEVISLSVDKNDNVLAEVVYEDGTGALLMIHPKTGEKLGEPNEKPRFFQFITNLHRSLFLKGVGRFFVGLVSLLLCFVAVTGLLLLIQRQGGIRKLFSKVQYDGFELYYHVSIGRWMLVPVILVAATGVYLSLHQFALLPNAQVSHTLPEDISEEMTAARPWELQVFQGIPLDRVRKITYPFSEFPEDYFELALREKEVYVHQYTGEFLSEQYYPFAAIALRWSMLLHTGQGSLWWSIVLALVALALLFFTYSGIVLWRKRKKSTKTGIIPVDKDMANIVLLVGSETGNTFRFAQTLQKALMDVGQQVFVSELNAYNRYEQAEHLIVLTATYGEGEAPANARHFHKHLAEIAPKKAMNYAVVGFGSLLYPQYCGFAITVEELLGKHTSFRRRSALYKINNQDFRAFQDWGHKWSTATGIAFQLKEPQKKKATLKPFQVVARSPLNEDSTFVLRLSPKKRAKFRSGDLAGIIPGDGIMRHYSMARVDREVVLSIKKHEHGLCSTFLSTLEQGDTLDLHITKNAQFHLPSWAKSVIFIANGTGIAPFLGMLKENVETDFHLFLGLRRAASLDLYQGLLPQERLASFHLVTSREEKRQYVQDALREKSPWVAQQLKEGAVLMLCGGLSMQNAVLEVLEAACREYLDLPLSEFENQEQLKMDCY